MRPRVDATRCRGFGICRELAPGYFSPDDWGLVQATGHEVAETDRPAVDHAIASCPYRAIRWLPPGARSHDIGVAPRQQPPPVSHTADLLSREKPAHGDID